MSDHDEPTTAPIAAVPPEDEEIFSILARGEDLGDDLWPTRPRRRRLALRTPTAILLALVIAAGAFWGGVTVQQRDGTTSSLSSALSSFRALRASGHGAFGGFGGGAGFGGGGAAAPAATGTLTAVVGNTLYLTTASGSLVTVTLTPATTIRRTVAASTSGLKSGDTIVVQGSPTGSGSVRARSITATAKGVSRATPAAGSSGGGLGAGSGGAAPGSGAGSSAGARTSRGPGTFGGAGSSGVTPARSGTRAGTAPGGAHHASASGK